MNAQFFPHSMNEKQAVKSQPVFLYKEKMSFEKADAIIMDGMGSQFDPALEQVYVAARPMLEKYYSSLEE